MMSVKKELTWLHIFNLPATYFPFRRAYQSHMHCVCPAAGLDHELDREYVQVIESGSNLVGN